jgi:taurine dioxygenase
MHLHPTGQFNNDARPYRHFTVRPLAAAMGAEIVGVDLRTVEDATFGELQDALYHHKMIYVRDQTLTHGDQEAFSRRWGEFAEDAYTSGISGHPNVHPLIKEADDPSTMVFGSGWHTDSPFLPKPPSLTILYAVEVPPWGGDTIWANSALAYASLSDTYRNILGKLKIQFSLRDVLRSAQSAVKPSDSPIGKLAATRALHDLPEHLQRKIAGSIHPLVRVHPVTGERALYVDDTYAVGIAGMTTEESAPLLKFITEHLTQPAFTCRLRWAAGTLAMWDNRLCVHQAFNDYAGHRRELYRTTMAGEVPQSIA